MNRRERIVLLSRQRGVLAVTTPLLIILIVLFTVLLLDGARLYAVKREMQAVANAAAMAAADGAQACAGLELENDQSIRSIAEAAAVAAGKQALGGDLTVIQAGTLTSVNDRWHFREFDQSVKESNAVKVVYSLREPISSLLPGLFGGVDMAAIAVARKEVVATVSAGGSTAVIGGDDQTAGLLGALLGALLTNGKPFALDATDVRSLASTTFALGGFLDNIGVSDLLVGADRLVPVDHLLEAILAGLGEGGGDAGDAIDQMLDAAGLITTNVRLGDVLRSVGPIERPGDVKIPVYDTVMAVVLNALSGNVVGLAAPREVNVGLGDIVSVDLDLTVGEAPAVLIAPARFEPNGDPMLTFEVADVILGLRVGVEIPGLATITVPLLVKTGGGSGYLAYADCAVGTSNNVLLGFLLQPEVVKVSTQTLQANGALVQDGVQVHLLEALRSLLTISVSARLGELTVGSRPSQPVLRELVFNLYSKEPVGAYVSPGLGVTSVGAGLEIDVDVRLQEEDCRGLLSWLTCPLGELLNPLLDELLNDITGPAIESLVNDTLVRVLNGLASDILGPLLAGLGLNLGGMSVDVTHVSQDQVVLLDCFLVNCELLDE
ncbi:hypothetical protein S7S_00500 [Isoalcanivorax pacificus W11-5]|uniref:DUF2134 domain-containing protein n=1 Tax=Isoalcanivorax pacificus W11-5 TaxID=391936 RepID=A0A0B4XET4_9GAMM|nr:hypothetical protein [Isoalcanivorax pacificus]AJD46524.1 hypothetical protein S7S_00500 [Isoalcanivorax pacificus W11-5]